MPACRWEFFFGSATPDFITLASEGTEPSTHSQSGPVNAGPMAVPLPSGPWQPSHVPERSTPR